MIRQKSYLAQVIAECGKEWIIPPRKGMKNEQFRIQSYAKWAEKEVERIINTYSEDNGHESGEVLWMLDAFIDECSARSLSDDPKVSLMFTVATEVGINALDVLFAMECDIFDEASVDEWMRVKEVR